MDKSLYNQQNNSILYSTFIVKDDVSKGGERN
jgi:hypothetical protein